MSDYDVGYEVAQAYWDNIPSQRDWTAERQILEAREELHLDITPEEERGFTTRWNELQAEGAGDVAEAQAN